MALWTKVPNSWRASRAGAHTPRAVATFLLAFQALVWGGGSIIEARSAAESLTRYAHVEDTGTTTCPPIHSDQDCLVCRTLSGGALGGSPPSVRPSPSSAAVRPEGTVVAETACTRSGPLGSRAPPSA